MKSTMKRTVTSLFLATAMVLSLVAVARPAVATEPPPVLGDYAAPLLGAPDANGIKHIDSAATVAALRSAHVNTYSYLIYGGTGAAGGAMTQTQWNDLPGFLTTAAQAGINVWVYLVPPSESFLQSATTPIAQRTSNYAPFYWNYVDWSTNIGILAASHTNLKAIAIDDFGSNSSAGHSQYSFAFTPANVTQMRNAARAGASWLEIYPVLYYQQFTGQGSISTFYRNVVDGVIFPYNDQGSSQINTQDSSNADIQSRVSSSMVKCAGTATCLQLNVPLNTQTATGQYVSVSQTVNVQTASSYKLAFRVNDDWAGGSPGGYHQLQVLIDGTVVWTKDVITWADWESVNRDVTAQLQGKTHATLTIRMYEDASVSNFHTSAWFDSITGSGFTVTNGSFENGLTGWTAAKTNSAFVASTVPSLKYFLMPYASRYGSEQPTTYQTTSAYTTAVAQVGLTRMREGKADGVMLYCMNLTGANNGLGDPATINSIASLYGNYPN